jgi:hypothetical protein
MYIFIFRLLLITHLMKVVLHNFVLILIKDGLVLLMIMHHNYFLSKIDDQKNNQDYFIILDVENRHYFLQCQWVLRCYCVMH